ncbi:stage III sporulation protein AG [Paenibacillus thailandensis]|uniref:Stage III sporulation protein AG n=1 Tax=Paenibacillus thailandensis TaxID=393250 RepID=A0ABW5QZC1_9BACL
MAKWLERLERAVGGGPSGPKRVRTLRILLIIGAIGAALMLMNSFLQLNRVEPSVQEQVPQQTSEEAWASGKDSNNGQFATIEEQLESRLKDILEQIVGVNSVDVMVTVDSTEEIVVKEEMSETQSTTNETDANGGRRHISSVTRDGKVVLYEVSGDPKPVVTKTISPRIRGIIVVAKGAENTTVKRLIADAISKGVSVPVSRISVVPRKQ